MRKVQIKTTVSYHIVPVRIASTKRQKRYCRAYNEWCSRGGRQMVKKRWKLNVGEDVKKSVGGKEWPSNSTSGYTSKEMKAVSWKR